MSIDARIIAAQLQGNGHMRLVLVPREKGGVAGQGTLTITNWPVGADPWGLIGTEIWGGAGEIMVGDTRWAERKGYTQIMLMPPVPRLKDD